MSLKGDKYETAEEVEARLESTIVLYNKEPVYITRVVPEAEEAGKKEVARVFFHQLPLGAGQGAEQRKYLSSKNFDLATPKLGYMNAKGQAIFVARNPIRQYKQGLSTATTTFSDIRGRASKAMGWAQMTGEKGFVALLKGQYPSFVEAGDLLDQSDSVALSRSFALEFDKDLDALILFNKGVKCGLAFKGDRGLKIPPKYGFLKEELEDCRIPIA